MYQSVFEKCFTQNMPQSGTADCGNDFSNTLWHYGNDF